MKKNILLLTAISSLVVACDGRKVVRSADPNLKPAVTQRMAPATLADPQASQQWSTQMLGLSQVWGAQQGSKKVKIAIVSSGVDYNHEDLRNNIYVNTQELVGADVSEAQALTNNKTDEKDSDGNGYVDDVVGYDFVENDGYAFDKTGHGTAIAGVIGAVHNNGAGIQGVMSDVNIIPVRYINENGQASLPRLISALRYAIHNNSDVIYLHLVNVDFSKPDPYEPAAVSDVAARAEKAAVAEIAGELDKRGIPMVVSVGNNAQNIDDKKDSVLSILRRSSLVVTVTATDNKDQKPFIANYGSKTVDLGAPGKSILTAVPGNKYEEQSGSHIAGAYVAGALGLALGQSYGVHSARTIVKKLRSESGGNDVSSLEYNTVTGRRLNISKFLSSL